MALMLGDSRVGHSRLSMSETTALLSYYWARQTTTFDPLSECLYENVSMVPLWGN